MPRYLLTNEVIAAELWKLLEANPAYSEDLTTKATVGTSAACTYFRFRPGVTNATAGDFPYLQKVSTLTLASDETDVKSLAVSGGYLYAGLGAIPGKVVKIDLSTFTKVATIVADSGANHVYALAVSGGYLYAAHFGNPARITKIDLSTFTKVATLTLDTGEDNATSLAVSGGYLYVGLNTTPGKIVKIDLSTFTRVATLTLDTGEDSVNALAVSGGYLYVGLNTIPGKIVKIDLSTFTKVSTLTLATGEDRVNALAVSGGYLYAGLGTAPSKVIKIDLSTFTKVATLTLATGENYIWSLNVSGGYLYAGLDTAPGKVVAIDLPTFTKVATLTFATGEDGTQPVLVIGTFLYAGLNTIPGKVVKSQAYPISGWRTDAPLNGYFEAGTWTFKVRLVNDTRHGFSVRVAARLTKAQGPDGSGPTRIAIAESPNVLALPARAGSSVTDTWSVSLPRIDMDNEYLFVEFRIHIQVAATNVNARCSFAVDQDPAVAEESVTTPAFVAAPPPVAEAITARNYPMLYLAKPPTATMLISKVEGATITHVAQDYPEILVKSGRARELRSKFTT